MSENYLDLLAGNEQTGDVRDRQAMLGARDALIRVKDIPEARVLALGLYSAIEHQLPRAAEMLTQEARDLLAECAL